MSLLFLYDILFNISKRMNIVTFGIVNLFCRRFTNITVKLKKMQSMYFYLLFYFKEYINLINGARYDVKYFTCFLLHLLSHVILMMNK